MSERSTPEPERLSEALRVAVERTLEATSLGAGEARSASGQLLDEVVRRGRGASDEVIGRGQAAGAELARRGHDLGTEASRRTQALGSDLARRGQRAGDELVRRGQGAGEEIAGRIAELLGGGRRRAQTNPKAER